MLSLLPFLPFLVIGLGMSGLFDDDADNATGTEPQVDPNEPTDGDMLDFVPGLNLTTVASDGTPIEGLITGGEGDDTITGGAADDVLSGEGGNDQIVGDLGSDTLTGGAGDDTMDGGAGDDVVDGGVGDDAITGGLGNDSLSGATGDDTLSGGAGDDILNGTQEGLFIPQDVAEEPDAPAEDPRDPMQETPIVDPPAPVIGNQLLDGGAGNDTLIGDHADTLTGGEGADSFVVNADIEPFLGSVFVTDFDLATDVLTLNVDGIDVGGDRTDDGFGLDIETRDLSDDSGMEVLLQGVVVATLAGVSEADQLAINVVATNGGAANPGAFSNFGDGDDTAMGDLSDDTLNGGAGNDMLEGAAGRDVLNGDTGNDTMDGGMGRDDLSGGTGDDLLIGGGNDETPVTTVVQERLDGGEGNDTLQSGDGFVALTGGEGTDVFEITRTEVSVSPPIDQYGVRVTEVVDLDVATEQVNITFVNGDASGAAVPFTLLNAPDISGVSVMIGGKAYVFLTGVLAADAPSVTVTGAA